MDQAEKTTIKWEEQRSFLVRGHKLLYAIIVVFCYSSAVVAQPKLVIENGRVIIGNGTVLEQASVVVAEDSILSVTRQPVEAPDARRIDASGKTILPGIIDAHVHLTIPPEGRDSTAVARHLKENVPGILRGFLEHGITTVRSTGSYWPLGGQLRDRIADGELDGPRIMTSGPVFTPEGGHPAVTVCAGVMEGGSPNKAIPFCRFHLAREVGNRQEARQAVHRLANEGVDFIKLASDTLFGPTLMDFEIMQAIADQAHQEGLKAVGHVYEARFMESAVRAGLDGFVHPPTMARPLPDDRARELAEVLASETTPVTSTLTPPMFFTPEPVGPYLRNQLSEPGHRASHAQDMAIFAEAGVPVVVGSDWCPCYPNTSKEPHLAIRAGAVTITEMKLLALGDLSRHEVVQAATANAAHALEMGDQVGTLEEGKLADLIVVDGNPLEDLSALEEIDMVVKDGEIVKSNSQY